MKQGTISVLFGCHSIIHSLVVIVAWRKWYGRWPKAWQIVCILIHDIGHWGKQYLDNYDEKKKHSLLGAAIAWQLFGDKGYDLIAGHNEYNGHAKSELYGPDKYSWVIAPLLWMTSNTYFERRLLRDGYGHRGSASLFKDAMRENMKTGFQEQGHDIYLSQWRHAKD